MRAESGCGLLEPYDLAEDILGDWDLRELVAEEPEVDGPLTIMVESYCRSGTGAIIAESRVPEVASGNAKSSQEKGMRFEEGNADQSVMSQKGISEVVGKVVKEEEEEEACREDDEVSKGKSIELLVGNVRNCAESQLIPWRLVCDSVLLGLVVVG